LSGAVARSCLACGDPVLEAERVVLLHGRREEVYCSERCLRVNVRGRQQARATRRRRWLAAVSALAAVSLTTVVAWRRHRAPPRRSISYAWPDVHGQGDPPPAPPLVGPPWPPTDAQWTALFDAAAWTFPLPGPTRRVPASDARLLGPEPRRDREASCRAVGHCGVVLGGELWGEHVYAALDGVVERVGADAGGRGLYVRFVHFGGGVFTQYLHLAATPRGIVRGARVTAGEVIGLLGDTGADEERPHLGFTLSVRTSNDLPELYWDPGAWLERAPLRLPPHGTVAGFTPPGTRASPP
jgi:murein DD-endopeptidase MepM/ murein hydrolase activator NlpD